MRPRHCRIQLDSSNDPRWSLPATSPTEIVYWQGPGAPACLLDKGRRTRTWDDPLEAVAFIDRNRVFNSQPGRWVGYFSYDMGRLFELLPSGARDDLNLPWFAFGYCPRNAERSPRVTESASHAPCSIHSTFTRQTYPEAVRRVLEYIRAGDVFQVNLSQRFSTDLVDSSWAIYDRLLRQAPASHGGCLDFGPFALICNSPELFLEINADRQVTTRPIKGTRPNAPGMAEELRHSLKDQAELNMIVDLQRNDLGRVCRVGSVKVPSPRDIEIHPTVCHGVATVTGQLRDDVGLVQLLAAAFPGGSVTGAPKIRAMQIIDELEPFRRGPYCGAIGYLDSDGTMQFNIAIRTMIAANSKIHIPVGGGIVADSDPVHEYEETLVKAKAMLDAVGVTITER